MPDIRLDDRESAYFERELSYVKQRTYDKKYLKLKAKQLIPLNTEGGEGITQIVWHSYEGFALAKIISNYANDIPRADISAKENTATVKTVALAYGYSIKEIKTSMRSGKNLEQRKANKTREGVEQTVDKIAWLGSEKHNIPGFINYPGITEYVIPAGASTDTEWESKTPDEIIADMNGIVSAVVATTKENEIPTTMLMPIDKYTLIAGMRMTDGDTKTVLKFFLENNPYIKEVVPLSYLKGAGISGSDRLMVYPKDEDNVTLEVPVPFMQLPAQQKGLEYEIITMEETAGVIIYYPLSVAYADGI